MQYRPLGNTGLSVSALSFGASSLGGAFGPISEPDGIRAVHVAIDHGINFIDVAPYYGATRAETVLGNALRSIPRDRYHLATKVGQYNEGEFDFSAERVASSVDESLSRLHTDHVDLIQCHDIEFADASQIIHETLPALECVKKQGKARHVGITGLPLKIFPSILDHVPSGLVETALSFCHYTLNDSSLANLIPYFKSKQVGVINAAPTAMGLLTTQGPPAWHPASKTIQEMCRRAAEYCAARDINIVHLAIQFSLANEDIATTVIGSAKPEEMLANIRYATTPVDPDELATVLEILAPIQSHNFTRGRPENRDPIKSS